MGLTRKNNSVRIISILETHNTREIKMKIDWMNVLLYGGLIAGGAALGWYGHQQMNVSGTTGSWGPYAIDRGSPRVRLGGGLNYGNNPATLWALQGGMDYGNGEYPLAVPQYPQPTPYDFNIPMAY
jgi:hypothetical protein